VNLGGEPERDDSGLPPVDIEIPDDARELDRDVQAYRRELRARRRRERRMRLHAPLTRDGVVLPLLASCLVLALIAGTLLTVFTAGPNGEGNLPGTASGTQKTRSPRSGSAKASASSPATSTGPAATSTGPAAARPQGSDSPIAKDSTHKLPRESIVPKTGKPLALASLLSSYHSLVIALVPAGCNCAAAVKRLVGQVHAAGLATYLVSAMGQLSKIQNLAPGVKAVIAEDKSGALYRDYSHRALTALLVHPSGTVSTVTLTNTSFILTTQLGELSSEADSATTSSPTTTATPR
jgi:hypothetical protein